MRKAAAYTGMLATALLGALAPCEAGCKLNEVAHLPVTIEGGRAIVPVQINGEEVRMIVDSGGFWSMLTLAAAKHANLWVVPLPLNFRLSGFSGDAEAALTTVKSFRLANVVAPNIQFIVGGTEMGEGASGIIGQNLLSWKNVEYDLGNGVVRFWEAKDCSKQLLAYWVTTEPLSLIDIEGTKELDSRSYGSAYLNGSKIRVLFDTGAPVSILARRAAERAGFKIDGPGVEPTGATAGLGQRWVQTWSARFDSFKLGGEEIRNARLRVGDTSSADFDLLLGLDFFLSHRIYVSNNQRRLYFTYNGGPVFNLKDFRPQAAAEAGPVTTPMPDSGPAAQSVDAAEFSRRGMALAGRHDYEHALEDLNRACELAPQESNYFAQRGQLEWQSGQADLAIKDLDQALLLKPDNLEALVARSQFRQRIGDITGAVGDLDSAANAATKEAGIRLDFGRAYAQMERYRQAIAQYDLWVAVHPEDADLMMALNERCWARALLGEELDQALSDCNKSLSINSKYAAALDSRGLVRYRRGEYKKALSDYNGSLMLQPKNAWSLYGRGLSKLRLGLSADGQADIDAAHALYPKIAEQAAKYGIVP